MEYILSGVAGIAMVFLVIFLIYNRKQELKIKRNIKDIKKIQTGTKDYFTFD